MSIKAYIHFEEEGSPEKTSKLTVPKKWVAEKSVKDVIGLFTEAYNTKFPDNAIDLENVHLTTSGGDKIYSNDKIGEVLTDCTDYFIKRGVHNRIAVTESKPTGIRCKNFGCNQFFTEEDNHDSACKYHSGPPIFHDCIKSWSCCKDKKAYDWDEFKLIEGCTSGRHSNIDKKSLFTESTSNNAAPLLKSISDFNTSNPSAANAAESAVKTIQTRKSSRKPDGTARCQNKGCQAVFKVEENSSTACTYHEGQPVFHDAIKIWSCCPDRKCYDFDEFMKVPGCKNGYHDDGEIDLRS